MTENWLLKNNNQTYKYAIHVFSRCVKHLIAFVYMLLLIYVLLLPYMFYCSPILSIAILCVFQLS